MSESIIVIGGGVIGLSLAWELQAQGARVTVLERDEPGRGASYGNAGHFATEQVFPLADPALLPQIPRMLLDPLGPFRIKLKYLPRVLPWMLRFLFNMTSSRRRQNQRALSAINGRAIADWRTLLASIGAEPLLSERGSLLVFESTANDEQQRMADGFRQAGVRVEWLDARQLHELEPALSPSLTGGLLFPDTGHSVDPFAICQALVDALRKEGVGFVQGEARSIDVTGSVTLKGGGQLQADKLVVCAGAWSRPLAAQLGHRVPLDTERGYHLMIRGESGLSRPVSSAERKFIVTPMAGGTRLAGTVEFAGLQAPMNPRRAEILLPHAKALLPAITGQPGEPWMGFRPSLPDSLPVLSASSSPKVYFSFGHQHLGLTQAATSARLMSALMLGRSPHVDLAPYRIDRFC
ncbi:NAD(P)/FAD-dependent oxidoreductase [Ferrimonas futtsuensis]|uniref:NAD(P)/FAD-dependent oxidoreductase n=1 Tax=Ferrimonas futtsuensis TaxID=364764 RepID=UPI0004027E96|nr:FAD-dependent oxidoreductase [Ferrimonas futtsuensis]